jgi:ABC-type amino acid transport substrate-binding protein
MTLRPLPALLLLSIAIVAPAGSVAQQTPSAESAAEELRVAVRTAPPFAMRDEGGQWRGLSVEAFEATADRLGWTYRYEPAGLDEALDGTRTGRYDLALGAFTVTAERERVLDFSHPFHTSGLGIAAYSEAGGGWLTLAGRFFSLEFLQVALALGALLLVFGFLVWLFERRVNDDEFGGPTGRGIGSGFWWAAVTMTTVGYGDKSPRTLGGRIVALVWMFAAIIVISSFTAAITSSLTVSRLGSAIQSVDDLQETRTATVAGSSSAAWLESEGLRYRSFDTLEQALDSVASGSSKALVYDAPLLKHRLRSGTYDSVQLLPETVERQDYALVLPDGSPRREALNRALLETISGGQWSDTVGRYLGP